MSTLNFNFMSSVANMKYVCEESPTVVDASLVFKDGMTTLNGMYAEAHLYEIILEGKTPGITVNYLNIKKTTSLNFSVATSIISGYGATIGDNVLVKMKHITYSLLLDMAPEKLDVKLDEILKVIDLHTVGLVKVGITPAFILKLIALKASVHSDKDNTQHAIKLHNETNDLYLALIAEMKIVITTILDPCAEYFKLDHQAFYLAYKNARKISHHHMHNKIPVPIDITTGTLGLTVNSRVTGLGLNGVTFTVLSINYTAITDENGEIVKDNFVPGSYTGVLTLDGYTPIEFTFFITKGIVNELGFMMEAIGNN